MSAQKKSNIFLVGTLVLAKRLNQKAVITQILSPAVYQIELVANGLKLKESVEYLERVAPTVHQMQENDKNKAQHHLNAGSAEIDLHGLRYEPALEKLGQFIDQAYIKHYSYIRVNHGKGSGALQAGVWRFLKINSQVKHFQFAPQNLGGRGVTIVELK